MSKVLDAAIRYATQNDWAVIPVHSMTEFGSCSCGAIDDYKGLHKHAMGKHPYPEHEHKDASKDRAQIETWWATWPHANVAIATGVKSKLLIVDFDKKNGGLESFAYLERRYGKLPLTPKVFSGGGGFHLYFKYPGYEVRGRRGMLPGIDVMCDGGRINAPPSNHKSKIDYKWDENAHPDTVPLALPPRWLMAMIMSKQATKKAAVK